MCAYFTIRSEAADIGVLDKIKDYLGDRKVPVTIDFLREHRQIYLEKNGKKRLTENDWPEFLKYLGKEIGGLPPRLEDDLEKGKVAVSLGFVKEDRVPLAIAFLPEPSGLENVLISGGGGIGASFFK